MELRLGSNCEKRTSPDWYRNIKDCNPESPGKKEKPLETQKKKKQNIITMQEYNAPNMKQLKILMDFRQMTECKKKEELIWICI